MDIEPTVTMTTIESEPISTIWLDLGEKLALKRNMRIRIHGQ